MKFLLFLSFFVFSFYGHAQLNVGNKFPVKELEGYKNSNRLKLVVFTPSLYIDNEYAGMLTTSLYYYFVKGLAFTAEKKPEIDVIYVVNDENRWEKESNPSAFFKKTNQNKVEGTTVIYDHQSKIYHSVGIPAFKSIDVSENGSAAGSTVFLLDKKNRILTKDTDYRAQGEHLKPIEKIIKEYYKTDRVSAPIAKSTKLKTGDKAPDFVLNGPEFTSGNTKKFSDLSNYFKVITFYPAAFSGQILPDFTNVDRMREMSCGAQIQLLDHNPVKNNVITLAVTSSTNELLQLWEKALRTGTTIYLNDADYTISELYNAYNILGYNNRATYVVNPKGVIVYANEDFTYEDEAKFPDILEDLVMKDRPLNEKIHWKMNKNNGKNSK